MTSNIFTFLQRGISQTNKYGLALLYWRYIYRQLILFQTPVYCPPNSDLEIHIQVCRRDWLNGLWTLSSFYYFVQQPFRLVLLHDGWLDKDKKVINIYKKRFPGIITYNRQVLNSQVEKVILPIAPVIARMWYTGKYFTLPKVVDSFLLSKNRYYLSIDPDILFFSTPHELLNGVQTLNQTSACWNIPIDKGHADGMFCFSPVAIKQLTHLDLPIPFGTGLGCVDRLKFDWNFADYVFSKLKIPKELIFMVDQTLFALFAAKSGFIGLPKELYAINPVTTLEGVIARHYYSKTRDLMYLEGISYLSHIGILSNPLN